jgi:hypothetical protein
MSGKARIRAVELIRGIRDRHAELLAGKSDADILAFFEQAGRAVRDDAKRRRKTETPGV